MQSVRPSLRMTQSFCQLSPRFFRAIKHELYFEPLNGQWRTQLHRYVYDMHPLVLLQCLILFLATAHVQLGRAQATTVTLPFVQTPPHNASQNLDPRLASFSIEFSYLTSFGGNKTHPNLLTKELMQRLVERTGVGPVSAALCYPSSDCTKDT